MDSRERSFLASHLEVNALQHAGEEVPESQAPAEGLFALRELLKKSGRRELFRGFETL